MDVPHIDSNGALGGSSGNAGGIRTSGGDSASGASDAATETSSLGSQTVAVEAAGSGLVFENSFSLDGTFAALTSSEQAALETDVQQAEQDLSREFTNSVTVNVDFEAVSVGGAAFVALNSASAEVLVNYASYVTALHNVATSNYQLTAVAAIANRTDLGNNPEVLLPDAYARMLGLSNSGTPITNSTIKVGDTTYNLSPSVDDTVFANLSFVQTALDNQTVNTPNGAIVGLLQHELTEDVMGRVGRLDSQDSVWGPTDLFRVNGAGQAHLTHDDGTAVFFSPAPGVTGPASGLQLNNVQSNGDYADWIYAPNFNPPSDQNLTDPFGPSDFTDFPNGSLSSSLSPTDIDVMNVLGWTISSGVGTPPLSIGLQNDTGSSKADKLTSDPTLAGVAAAHATVTLTENGVTLGTATADAGGAWTFKPTLSDGQHTIIASESFGAGQTVTASLTFSLTTESPSIDAMESIAGQTSETTDTITVSATAENVGGNAIAGVEIFDGTADLGPATLSNGSWAFTAQNLLPGPHKFTAIATDLAGNAGAFSLPQVVVNGSQTNNPYTLSGFTFTGDGVTDIRPKGINDSGEIVGYYLDGRADDIGADGQSHFEHGFYSTLNGDVRQYTSIDDSDAPIDAKDGEASGPDRTRAFSVNNKGDIVGWYSQDESGTADNGTTYVLPDAGFIMSANWPGTFGKLSFNAFGDFGTHAIGINSSDQIVGYYVDGTGEQHGFLRQFTGYGVRGGYVSVDPPNSINTIAEGINDSGEIVGYYETSNRIFHGFTYDSGTGAYTTIDVNGAADTEPLGVNNSGEIVGEYIDSAGKTHGFVASASGQITTVDDPNAGTGGTLVSGINNEGEIVGWYLGTDGHSYGFTGAPSQGVGGGSLSEIVFQNTDGQAALWEMNGNTLIGGGAVSLNPGPSWTEVGTGDFNADGLPDILWQNANGQAAIWEMNGTNLIGGGLVGVNPGPSWKAIGTGDFTKDGFSDDILFQNTTTGQAAIWEMNGTNLIGGGTVNPNPGPAWKAVGTGDFNDDGFSDILFQNTSTGQVSIWEMNGTNVIDGGTLTTNPGPAWQAIGTGDFNGDHHSDILFQNTGTGQVSVWEMSGTNIIGGGPVSANPGTSWRAIGSDGRSDILLQNTSGQTSIWDMNGHTIMGGGPVSPSPGTSWRAVGLT
jgi:hypothetical protein